MNHPDVLRYGRIAAALLACLAAGALSSIAIARTSGSAASASYYYYCPGGGAGGQYGYCPPTTTTTTTPNAPPVYIRPANQLSDEGETKSFQLGSFSDANGNGPWEIRVTWGDGSTAETFSVASQGTLPNRSHTYAENGIYTVTVRVEDAAGASDTGTFQVTVANLAPSCGPIAATPAVVAVGAPMSTSTPFTDPGTQDTHTAVMGWGDGTSSAATVTETNGSGTATATHTYTSTGFFTLTLTVTDDEGASGQCTRQVLVYGLSPGGNFVIGNLNSAVGSSVTFWSDTWWSLNALSGGPAPMSFKGFSNQPAAAPVCGRQWSTRGGNSPPPASSIPNFMAVIVSSSVTKSGSTIRGNSPRVVVVRTNPGYDPSPGHPGTGTVVGVIC